jgi:hypothetical protein
VGRKGKTIMTPKTKMRVWGLISFPLYCTAVWKLTGLTLKQVGILIGVTVCYLLLNAIPLGLVYGTKSLEQYDRSLGKTIRDMDEAKKDLDKNSDQP